MLGEVRRVLPGAPELGLWNPVLPLCYNVKPALGQEPKELSLKKLTCA